jgi:membrane-associated protease RseP (regulator of RpoE activity)
MADERDAATEATGTPRPARPRSPLIIGAIAYAILFWMMLVVCLVIAWRLSTQ